MKSPQPCPSSWRGERFGGLTSHASVTCHSRSRRADAVDSCDDRRHTRGTLPESALSGVPSLSRSSRRGRPLRLQRAALRHQLDRLDGEAIICRPPGDSPVRAARRAPSVAGGQLLHPLLAHGAVTAGERPRAGPQAQDDGAALGTLVAFAQLRRGDRHRRVTHSRRQGSRRCWPRARNWEGFAPLRTRAAPG